MTAPIDLSTVLSGMTSHWQPVTVATLNDYDLRVVKTQGEFTWHRHPDTDEVFLVLAGELTIRLRSGQIQLRPGQLYVVPRGTEHCPSSDVECSVLLIEPSSTVNTGDSPSERTAARVVLE
ncbi:MAG: cupin domain-containing protein [Pseudonocardia sp.]|nr:cupin domain-containing protein [Pseudonocardia sp.]